jgi:hypothetical protein
LLRASLLVSNLSSTNLSKLIVFDNINGGTLNIYFIHWGRPKYAF